MGPRVSNSAVMPPTMAEAPKGISIRPFWFSLLEIINSDCLYAFSLAVCLCACFYYRPLWFSSAANRGTPNPNKTPQQEKNAANVEWNPLYVDVSFLTREFDPQG